MRGRTDVSLQTTKVAFPRVAVFITDPSGAKPLESAALGPGGDTRLHDPLVPQRRPLVRPESQLVQHRTSCSPTATA